MIETDLFEFAYVPDWYGQLEQLAEMALPEAWRFRKPQTECKNTDTALQTIFTDQFQMFLVILGFGM